jgi:hypothetical protein
MTQRGQTPLCRDFQIVSPLVSKLLFDSMSFIRNDVMLTILCAKVGIISESAKFF